MSDTQCAALDRIDTSSHGLAPAEPVTYPPSGSLGSSASRKPSITSLPLESGYVTPITVDETEDPEPIDIEDCPFDTDTFPDESYLYPSDRNGTACTEALHAIKHPRDTDWEALRNKLRQVAESTSDRVNLGVNHAFDGYDLPAIHNRIYNVVPSVSMPNMRQLGKTLDNISENACELVDRSRSMGAFVDEELQGDKWAFARIMNAEARRALLKQKIREEWQLTPSQDNVGWLNELNEALAALFTREKSAFGVAALFSMTPHWVPDFEKKMWCLELDTGFTNIVVDEASDEYVDVSLLLSVDFELPDICGNLDIGDVVAID